jgi:hypothetical protein
VRHDVHRHPDLSRRRCARLGTDERREASERESECMSTHHTATVFRNATGERIENLPRFS